MNLKRKKRKRSILQLLLLHNHRKKQTHQRNHRHKNQAVILIIIEKRNINQLQRQNHQVYQIITKEPSHPYYHLLEMIRKKKSILHIMQLHQKLQYKKINMVHHLQQILMEIPKQLNKMKILLQKQLVVHQVQIQSQHLNLQLIHLLKEQILLQQVALQAQTQILIISYHLQLLILSQQLKITLDGNHQVHSKLICLVTMTTKDSLLQTII